MKLKDITWYSHQTDDNLGFFPTEITPAGDYICPQCGHEATRWEGIIGQDRMGNDIQGWGYDCFVCGIGTEAEEF